MEKIYEILAEVKPENDYKSSSDFIEDGLLDSFDVITLIDIIEERFSVKVDGMDIVPENFCSAEAIAELINKNGGSI